MDEKKKTNSSALINYQHCKLQIYCCRTDDAFADAVEQLMIP